VAARLAEEVGYQAASLEAVAARARCGKQTIYRRWGSKARLFLDVYAGLAAAERLRVDTGSLEGGLEALLAELFGVYAATPARSVLAGLIADAQGDAAVADVLRAGLVEGRRAVLGRVLERARERGELDRSLDPRTAADLVSAAVWFRLLLGHAPLDEAYARDVARVLARGFGAGDGGRV
jgi:AcrR family transcriptional regulator